MVSLRNAFAFAGDERSDGVFTITFDPAVFSTHQTITLNSGTFTIDENGTANFARMIIQGPLAGVTIDANQQSGVFNVKNSRLDQLDLSNLTLVNSKYDAIDGPVAMTLTNVTVENSAENGAVQRT